jgi:hypothetical protein
MSSVPFSITTHGIVGPQANLPGTGSAGYKQLYTGELGVADVHSRYQEAALNGNVFGCVNSAAQALSLTGTTTYTGMVVYNRPNSGKNLILITAAFAPTIAETGVGAVILFSQAIAASLPSLTATNVAGSPFGTVLSGVSTSVASVASSCTLAANPIFLRPLMGIPWVTATAQSAIVCRDEIAGEIVVPPGAGVGFVAVTTAITGIAYLSWEEVPIANVG